MHRYAYLPLFVVTALLLAAPVAAQPADATDPAPLATRDLSPGQMAPGMIVTPGELPDYDALRLQGDSTDLGDIFLTTLPTFDDDVLTSNIVFPEVPVDSPYAQLGLAEVVQLALEGNFGLENSQRGILIARSSTRSAEANFIPFVDLVGDSTFRKTTTVDATRTIAVTEYEFVERRDPVTGVVTRERVEVPTTRQIPTIVEDSNWRSTAGVESGVVLPTGGRVTLNATEGYTSTRRSDGGGVVEDFGYDADANIRYIQPLLRGGGFDVATADLRRSRISEMDRLLGHRLSERDVVLDVISTYFQLLQTARQLQVSRDAIRERLRFLDETVVKYNVGRVDESEILRAEIQYLSELETAIGRRRTLDDTRESLLLLLGLPLDTPISFIDITDELAAMGRVDIPAPNLAIEEALANRLELMRADLSLALSRIDLRLAQNDVLPDLGVSGGYGRFDSGRRFPEAQGFENSSWDVGIAGRLPLVNIQRRESLRRSTLSLQNSETDRLRLERDLIRGVLTAHRGVLTTEAQLTILSKNVEQARKTLQLINGRFEVGFATVTEVRLAQDDLFQSETRYANTLLNYQLQLARLYVALGRKLY